MVPAIALRGTCAQLHQTNYHVASDVELWAHWQCGMDAVDLKFVSEGFLVFCLGQVAFDALICVKRLLDPLGRNWTTSR